MIQKRRNKKAVKRLLKKLVKKQKLTPRVIVTDKLKSYGAPIKEME
ncbi:DDE-type integrase/transposase/recombinase [Xenococcus sp. PCC 7305]